jgi:hypothetical protein
MVFNAQHLPTTHNSDQGAAIIMALKAHSPDDILSPIGKPPARTAIPLARRVVEGLAGRVVGLLDNSKQNASIILDEMELLLRAGGVGDVIRRRKPSAAMSGGALLEELAEQCDAIVNAMGDCGSCTSWCVHDSVDLERLGTPVATILTSEFASLGFVEVNALGMTDLPIVTLPHPIGSLPTNEVRAHARRAFADVVAVLTRDETDRRTLYGSATSSTLANDNVAEDCGCA